MKQLWMGIKIAILRLRFVLVFVAVGVVVGNWTWIMNWLEKHVLPRPGQEEAAGDIEYFCPMDPGVLREKPGNCPVCGMPLSKRKKGAKPQLPENVLHRLQLSPYQIRQAGVATEEVTYRLLVREIRAVGFIEYDERRMYDITARVPGRIEKFYKNFIGQEIKAGEPYASIYSPELLSTQEDYLRAIKGADDASKRLAEAARKRLQLWGITDAQIAAIEKEGKANPYVDIVSPYGGVIMTRSVHLGHFLNAGDHVYEVADLSSVWMLAEVYEDDIGLIKEGQGVEVTGIAYPDRKYGGKVAFISPTLEKDTRTVKVRVDVENARMELKPGMFVTARLKIPIGQLKEVYYGCWPGCPDVRSDEPGKCPKCAMMLVKQGGVKVEGKKEYFCPMHPEIVRDEPGDCPKCNMHLEMREKKLEGERKVYVCDVHPEAVFDAPGKCFKGTWNGMQLEVRKVAPGSKLVWVCPDHTAVVADTPGKCKECGHDLHFKIVSESTVLGESFICPMHPEKPLDKPAACPDCGTKEKRMEYEKHLAVPVSAVIDSGDRKVVFVESRPGVFDMRKVELGPRAGDYFPLIKALAAGERVATAGAFLLDAEARLDPSAAVQYFGAQDTKK